jgi:DNA-binding CsgD family transcriptional regulator
LFCFPGRESFVHKFYVRVEFLPEPRSKLLCLERHFARVAREPQRMADDNKLNGVVSANVAQAAQIVPSVLAQERGEGSCREAEIVRNSEADSLAPVVNRQNPPLRQLSESCIRHVFGLLVGAIAASMDYTRWPPLVEHSRRGSCGNSTGIAPFSAGACGSPDQTIDLMGGGLAVPSLRGHNPDDFIALVPAEETLATDLVSQVREFLAEGRAMSGSISLRPRQEKILRSKVRNRATKETAANLPIRVRAVKIHVFALSSKFGVESRADLARRAAGLLLPEMLEDGPIVEKQSVGTERRQASRPVASDSPAHPIGKEPSVRFLITRLAV